jgi:Ferritin-like domain
LSHASPHEHLDLIDNVLQDTSTTTDTRRALLSRAAVATAVAGAAGLMDPVGTAFAEGRRRGGDSVKTVGTIAVTAEALAVTYLTQVLNRPPSDTPATVAQVLKAADLEEYRHYRFLRGAGFKPLTTTFYLPDALFGPGVKAVAAVIELAEELFVNAYLIGITTFARAGNAKLARYAGEILGVEAEHRALARFVQGKLPNNRAYEQFKFHRLADIVEQLRGAGIGFGKPTKQGGKAYHFRGVGNAADGVSIQGRDPR